MLRWGNICRRTFNSTIIISRSKSLRGHYVPRKLTECSSVAAKCFHTQLPLRQNWAEEPDLNQQIESLNEEVRKTGRINRREIQEVLEDIREMKTATSSQSLMIIRWCGGLIPTEIPENRTKLVQEVWKTMENLNVPVDISHYNALLKVYLENEHKFDPTFFLEELATKGIEPNRVTFQRLIAYFCQQGDIEGATTILQHMKDKQIPINEHVFNSFIVGHCQLGDMASAEGMVEVLKSSGLQPNDDTYIALISGFAKMGDIENIQRLCKQCQDMDVYLVDRDFLHVIYVLADNGHPHLIDEIIPYLTKAPGFFQEATSVVLRLVNAGHEEVAFRVLKMMQIPVFHNQEEQPVVGTFFVQQLVAANTPPPTIIKYCLELAEMGIHKYALSRACESSLASKRFGIAVPLLRALQRTGFPVRQHYFLPFFTTKVETDVMEGLRLMSFFRAEPTHETTRDYIVPALLQCAEAQNKTLPKFIGDSGQVLRQFPKISTFLMQRLLEENRIGEAGSIAPIAAMDLSLNSCRRALVEGYIQRKDAPSLARIVAHADCKSEDSRREWAGAVLLEVLQSCGNENLTEHLNLILSQYKEYELRISNSVAEVLQLKFEENLTPDLVNIISQLTSEVVPQRAVEKVKSSKLTVRQADEIEHLYELGKADGRIDTKFQKMLLIFYCETKNLMKAERLRAEMIEQGFEFKPFLLMHVLQMYCVLNKVESAREVFMMLTGNDAEFRIRTTLLLFYLNLLASSGGNFEEVLKVISATPKGKDTDINKSTSHLVARLLRNYAKDGKVEEVKQLFGKLIEHEWIKPNDRIVLHQVVRAYLSRNDLGGAVTEFSNSVKQFRYPAARQELYCACIHAEDSENLQSAHELNAALYGESSALHDLAVAFLECGKISQAKKILCTPGLRAINDKLDAISDKYIMSDRTEDMENLVQITKTMYKVNRCNLYHSLLKMYIKQNNVDKASNVWTSLQEEDIQASVELMTDLASFFRQNNIEVPFVLPEPESSISEYLVETKSSRFAGQSNRVHPARRKTIQDETQEKTMKNVSGERTSQFSENVKVLYKSNVSEKKNTNISREASKAGKSKLNTLVDNQEWDQALAVIKEMALQGFYPPEEVLLQMIHYLTQTGNENHLLELQKVLTPEQVYKLKLKPALAMTQIKTGKYEECFENHIRVPIEKSKTRLSVAPTVALELLKIKPEFASRLEGLPQKNKKIGSDLSVILWAHFFSQKDFEKARNLLKNKINPKSVLLIRDIVSTTVATADLDSATELWYQVRDSCVASRSKAEAAGCLIDILRSRGLVTAALEVFENALKTINLTEFPTSVVVKLKSAAVSGNVPFPYGVPHSIHPQQDVDSSSSEIQDADVQK